MYCVAGTVQPEQVRTCVSCCAYTYCDSVTTTDTSVALVRDGFDKVASSCVSIVPSFSSTAALLSLAGLKLEKAHVHRMEEVSTYLHCGTGTLIKVRMHASQWW